MNTKNRIKKRKFGKKAILFSLMSVLFSILFVTIFSQNFTSTYEDRMPSSNIRIKAMDIYTKNMETYIGSSIGTSTYRALDAITIYRSTHGGFFNNSGEFNQTFSNCIICGYVNCSNQIPSNNCNLSQYTLVSRLNNITTLSLQEMNIKMEYKINSIEISQENHPFIVQVKLNISYNVTDNSGGNYYATWSKNEQIITRSVSIIGLLDPKGYINDTITHDGNRTIIEYTGECAYNEACWNLTNVEQFYTEKSFRYYVNGTSFLHRYWNDNTPSEVCGLETILHPSDISNLDKKDSYIDHYYWENTYTCSNGKILNISINSDSVHLDDITAARYNVGGNDYCIS
jgi:hypothetical protein